MTKPDSKAVIILLEDKLRTAMLNCDIATLDKLISDDLVFRNHENVFSSKEEDLRRYREGLLRFTLLEQIELDVVSYPGVGVASVVVSMEGELNGNLFNTSACFTRTWVFSSGCWVVAAVHVSLCS